nr:MAG TPA: hypothetical protein [Bacteriophage sp.]
MDKRFDFIFFAIFAKNLPQFCREKSRWSSYYESKF